MPEPPLGHIVLASDLGPTSDPVLMRGATLALRNGAELTLLQLGMHGDSEARERRALELLTGRMQSIAGPVPARPAFRVVSGHSAEEIASAIRSSGADLTVVGQQAPDVLGELVPSALEKAVQLADCPTLIARLPFEGTYRAVLVATEASLLSLAAARFARVLAPEASFVAVHVVDSPFRSLASDTLGLESGLRDEGHRALAAWIDALGGETMEALILIGDPAASIMDTARERGNDLIVLCTRASRPITRLLIGSVADRVRREASCDVLLVPPDETPP